MKSDTIQLSEVFKALSNPYRLKMLASLSERPRTTTELSKQLKISPPLVSIHIRKLLKACLIRDGERETVKRGNDPPLNKQYYEIADFNFHINPKTIKEAVGK